jgi:CheY-like chemotaxis protein
MPQVDGERFIKKIKSMPEFKHIPIFVITSHKELVEIGLPGVEKILLKPFNPSHLKQLLKDAVTSM